ncbi:MAG TPA: WcbI family polysaccharide biosynthesis putative acetyltransferase [Stellaceae bacterium]|nr:WcbI family polysaccharide biosynthesis putative acetyltransferase [Stellaceae bacterium]
MKIGVIGNCSASAIGMTFQQLLEDCDVFSFEANAVLRANNFDHAFSVLKECDIVFSLPLPDQYGILAYNNLKAEHKNVQRLPNIVFTGFHPDCIYCNYNDHLFESPLEVLHSAIIAAAFSLHFNPRQTYDLFNDRVYRQLGYFDEFEKARVFLSNIMQGCGLDLSAEWPHWMSRGAFMYTTNHPRAIISARVATLMAIKSGLVPPGTPVPEPLMEELALHTIWPVYPPIAEALGFRGSYLFKKQGQPDRRGGGGSVYEIRRLDRTQFRHVPEIPKGDVHHSCCRKNSKHTEEM